MPSYLFKCKQCNLEIEKQLAITDYLSKDQACDCGEVLTKIIKTTISSRVDRDKRDIVEMAKDFGKATAEKVMSGNAATIRDVYGDRENPYKK